AVHSTIQTMVKRGIFEMADDPDDGRIRIVQLTAMGDAMRRDARTIVEQLTESLVPRIGADGVAALRAALDADWGTPPLVKLDQKGQGAEEFRRSSNKNP